MSSLEQEARDLLEKTGVPETKSYTAGDLIFLVDALNKPKRGTFMWAIEQARHCYRIVLERTSRNGVCEIELIEGDFTRPLQLTVDDVLAGDWIVSSVIR